MLLDLNLQDITWTERCARIQMCPFDSLDVRVIILLFCPICQSISPSVHYSDSQNFVSGDNLGKNNGYAFALMKPPSARWQAPSP